MSRVRVPLSAHSKVAPWPQQKWCGCCGSTALPKVSRTSSAAWRRKRECGHHNGLWRSLVALPLWVREVAGSNPASPTTRRDTERLACPKGNSIHHDECGERDALPGRGLTLGGDDGPLSRCGISVDSLPADIRGVVLLTKGLTSPPAPVAQWIRATRAFIPRTGPVF